MSVRMQQVPGWVKALMVGGTFATLLWWEGRRPLRRKVESKLRHDARNLAMAALANATVQIAERPVVEPLCRLVERRHCGLLKQVRLPVWLEVPLAVALLDYTLYLWHILTHRVPMPFEEQREPFPIHRHGNKRRRRG